MATPSIPHSREAEEAVVGAVLINPDMYYEIATFLTADDFYIHRHRWIWEAYARLVEKRVPIDILTVQEEMDRVGQLEEAGGPAYLTALLNQVPSSLNAPSYARVVEAHATRRRLINAANQIGNLAYDQENEIEYALSESAKALQHVSVHRVGDTVNVADIAPKRYDASVKRAESGESLGIATPHQDLNALLGGGYQDGNFYIVAGRTSQGKSTKLIQDAAFAAQNGEHVYLASLEMSAEDVTDRIISLETGIEFNQLRHGDLDETEWGTYLSAIQADYLRRIEIDDTPSVTPFHLRSRATHLRMQGKCDLVIVDYVQLMWAPGYEKNRVQEVSYISRNLKLLARELDVPLLAAAQINRAPEQRADARPRLSDLRESGSLENDADVVMLIWRNPKKWKPEIQSYITTMLVEKQRNGPTGPVDMVFVGGQMQTMEYRENYQQSEMEL